MSKPAWTDWGGVPTEPGLWWQQFKDGRLQGVCYTEDDTPYNSVGIRYHGPHGGPEPPEEPKEVLPLWSVECSGHHVGHIRAISATAAADLFADGHLFTARLCP